MNTRARLALTVSLLALGATAGPAVASPEFYAGLGLEYGDAEVSLFPASNDLFAGSVIVGAQHTFANNFFIGAEGDMTLFMSYDSGSSTGDLDRIWRLRGRAGYDFGQVSVFGAVGGVWTEGELGGAPFEDTSEGLTYGGGIDYSLNEQFDLRLEVIHDETEFENGAYEWENTSVRAGAIIRF